MDEDERHEVSERENMAAVDNITKIFDWDLQNGDLSAWFRLSELYVTGFKSLFLATFYASAYIYFLSGSWFQNSVPFGMYILFP